MFIKIHVLVCIYMYIIYSIYVYTSTCMHTCIHISMIDSPISGCSHCGETSPSDVFKSQALLTCLAPEPLATLGI